ncbi:LytTR family DNA-binding domain-containing protein [Sphingomonas oligophenolica]|uniref:LytTR family DNA-binding domain-containing protein n=1 Tax=Sphingomonas oligophenolica TaxID=301154 RepID=A0ABU9Y0U6_9SPHN
MKPLRAILVDDEPLALGRLSRSLEAIEEVAVIGSTTSSSQALRLIGESRPDVVFLDIAMPGLNGFELVERLSAGDLPAIVFVTAFDTHAVKAFGVDAADYLLKPVAPDRLRASLGRARAWLDGRPGRDRTPAPDADAGREAENAAPAIDSLWAHRHREAVRIDIDSVDLIEAEGDYVRLHSADGGGLVRMTLSALEARLDGATFIRIHRSAICRRSAITGLRRKSTGALVATLGNGDEVPVGRKFGGGLRTLLRRMQR